MENLRKKNLTEILEIKIHFTQKKKTTTTTKTDSKRPPQQTRIRGRLRA
jgi:hypothetical protein